MNGNLQQVQLWIGIPAGVLVLLFIAFGATGHGSVHVDSNYLTLPAVSWASGQGFVNPILPIAQTWDPEGLGRFLYHGPAFQIVLRAFLFRATGPQALAIIHWMNAANVIVFALFLWRIARANPAQARNAGPGAPLVALLAFGAVLVAAIGRPETLAILITLFGAHLLLGSGPRSTPGRPSRSILIGTVLGVLFVTHPVTGAEMGLLVSAWYAFQLPTRAALGHIAVVGATAASVALAFLAIVFPFPVGDWVAGMRGQMAVTATLFDFRVLRFFVRDVRYPAYGLTLLLGVVVCAAWWWRNRGATASRWLMGVSISLFLVLVGRMMLLLAFRAYDSYSLFALLAAALVVAAGRVGRLARIGLLFVLALPGIGFARTALLFPSYLTNGMSLTEARTAFEQVLEEERGSVGVTRSLWLLTEDYDRLRVNFSLTNIDDRTGTPLDVVVVQQYHHPSVDSLPGYQRIRSYRKEGFPTFLGIPLAWSTPGYQFDVYRRQTTSSGGA